MGDNAYGSLDGVSFPNDQASYPGGGPTLEQLELQADLRSSYARAQLRKQTKGRLISTHKTADVNTDPTPGAKYAPNEGVSREQELQWQSDYAKNQWANEQGVVGPNFHENEGATGFLGFNDPDSSSYELNQDYAYQHDLQAVDAEHQVPAGDKQAQQRYDTALKDSAVHGMIVLKVRGNLDMALDRARQSWKAYGFTVRQSY